jgi:hypothetical protein
MTNPAVTTLIIVQALNLSDRCCHSSLAWIAAAAAANDMTPGAAGATGAAGAAGATGGATAGATAGAATALRVANVHSSGLWTVQKPWWVHQWNVFFPFFLVVGSPALGGVAFQA